MDTLAMPLAIVLGFTSYVTGIRIREFAVLGWAHWFMMYFVNMLCFYHTARSVNIGRKRTAGTIMYATIPFVTVLAYKVESCTSESPEFILATVFFLAIPLKKTHRHWYHMGHSSARDVPGGPIRVLCILLMWVIRMFMIYAGTDARIYQLISDVAILCFATNGMWE